MLGTIVMAMLVAQAPVTTPGNAAQQPPAGAAAETPKTPWPPLGVSRPGNGVTTPQLIKDVKPHYRADAMRAKIEGVIKLEAVVETDGTVGEIRLTRSLDRELGMDEEAVACLKKWRFKPGTKDGVAVPVLVEVEMTFTLRK